MPHDHDHDHGHDHGHSHGLVDRSILRSRAGVRAVAWSLGILAVTALAQTFIYSRTLSVALLLGLAFFFRSVRGERIARLGVVLAIFISALVALWQTIERFVHPRSLSHLWLLAAAEVGFVGSAAVVGPGLDVADPIIGLGITLVILKITWDSWHTVRNAEIDLEHIHEH